MEDFGRSYAYRPDVMAYAPPSSTPSQASQASQPSQAASARLLGGQVLGIFTNP